MSNMLGTQFNSWFNQIQTNEVFGCVKVDSKEVETSRQFGFDPVAWVLDACDLIFKSKPLTFLEKVNLYMMYRSSQEAIDCSSFLDHEDYGFKNSKNSHHNCYDCFNCWHISDCLFCRNCSNVSNCMFCFCLYDPFDSNTANFSNSTEYFIFNKRVSKEEYQKCLFILKERYDFL